MHIMVKGLMPALTVAGLAVSAGGQSWNQSAKTFGDGGKHGEDVRIWGDTVVVGAEYAAPTFTGAAYVLERHAGGLNAWGQALELVPSTNIFAARFGSAVGIHADTIVVGARLADAATPDHGAAFVFERDLGGPEAWGERTRIDSPEFTIEFGNVAAIDGDTIAIGVPKDSGPAGSFSGAVYLYERDLGGQDAWGFLTKLVPPDVQAFDQFGYDLALRDDTLMVSSAAGQGAVYVHGRNQGGAGAWGQLAKLTAEDGGLFGGALALHGDTLVVGTSTHGMFGQSAGLVFVLERNLGGANNWGESAHLIGSQIDDGDFFGSGVDIRGDRILVGARGDEPFGINSGAAYVFQRHLGGVQNWGEQSRLIALDGDHNDELGFDVALWGDTAIAGAPGDEPIYNDSGSVYVFEADHAVSYCTPGASASYCMATLFSTGLPSASATSGFLVHAASVEGAKDGLFFFGTNGRQANPWGNGSSLQCVVPPVVRAGLLTASGSIDNCDGAFLQDLNQLWSSSPNKNPGSGAVVQLQLWYRDPQSTSNQTTSLSDAIEFTVGL